MCIRDSIAYLGVFEHGLLEYSKSFIIQIVGTVLGECRQFDEQCFHLMNIRKLRSFRNIDSSENTDIRRRVYFAETAGSDQMDGGEYQQLFCSRERRLAQQKKQAPWLSRGACSESDKLSITGSTNRH